MGEHEKREKQAQLEERELERKAEAEPKIQRAKDDIDVLGKEIELMRVQKETFQGKHDEYNGKCEELEQEVEANTAIHKGHEQEHNKIKGDPDRIRKQAEKFDSAVNALLEAQREKKKDIEETNELVKQNEKKQKDAEEQRAKKQM